MCSKPMGIATTEELHSLNLKQDAWDNMHRFTVWADSAKLQISLIKLQTKFKSV
ncbi:UNVERIFIED_ORG: hypothetical protein [Escherichia phage CMSTMSU]